jgi:hypothetical protein
MNMVLMPFTSNLYSSQYYCTLSTSPSPHPISHSVISQSKAYLFVVPALLQTITATTLHPAATREMIVGLVAQHIESALKIAVPVSTTEEHTTNARTYTSLTPYLHPSQEGEVGVAASTATVLNTAYLLEFHVSSS